MLLRRLRPRQIRSSCCCACRWLSSISVPEDTEQQGSSTSEATVSEQEAFATALGVRNAAESMHRALETLDRSADLFRASPDFAIPEVRYSQIENGCFPYFVARQISRRGVVIVREAVPEATALRWRDSVIDYLLGNGQWVRPPVEHPRYWSHPQLMARENPRIATVLTALTALWHTEGSTVGVPAVDLQTNLTYCDRLCIGKPCSPHGDFRSRGGGSGGGGSGGGGSGSGSGAAMGSPAREHWLHPRFTGVYRPVIEGRWEEWDPFHAGPRAALDQALSGSWTKHGAFRPWQGFLSLAPWLQQEGNLRLVPLLRAAMAYALLQPFTADAPPAADTGESSVSGMHGLRLNERDHAPLLRALVTLPPLSAGDLVLWHPDIAIAESLAAHLMDREYVALYMSAMPATAGNLCYLDAQREAFSKGRTPHPMRTSNCRLSSDETDFVGRATEVDLTPAGRKAMGLRQQPKVMLLRELDLPSHSLVEPLLIHER